MEERSMSMRGAMVIVYNSQTYAALNNLETGLYYQSPAYLYDTLSQELSPSSDNYLLIADIHLGISQFGIIYTYRNCIVDINCIVYIQRQIYSVVHRQP